MLAIFSGIFISNSENIPIYLDKKNFDRYGGWKEVSGTVTGFFHVQKIDDIWWFITPEGNGFLSVGVNSLSPDGDWSPKLNYSPYRRSVDENYRSVEKWTSITLRRLKAWGINTIGGFSPMKMWSGKSFPYVVSFALGDLGGANWQKGIFPDVFDPLFKDKVHSTAKSVCNQLASDPFLIGYFPDNELNWKNAVNSLWALKASAPGKKAIIDFLRKRYDNDFNKFKKVWETPVRSFDKLGKTREFKLKPKKIEYARKDLIELFLFIVRKYFEITTNAIRHHDQNHLILGVRFAPPTPSLVVEEIGRYVDVVSVNYYPKNKFEHREKGFLEWHKTMVTAGNVTYKDWLKDYTELSKKPLLITEFSFKANDSGLPNTKGGGLGFVLSTQHDRADMFEWFAKKSAKKPYILGYHWFQYMDQPKEGRFDGENSNLGLVDIQDRPYYPLVERMKVLNREIYTLHRGSKAD